ADTSEGSKGIAYPSLHPAKPYSAKSGSEAFVRGRSGHNKAKPQLGRISALAGRKSRKRAVRTVLTK
ncbi:TPA: hypothetical protein ACNRXQ_005020, partial [Escherichia coli]